MENNRLWALRVHNLAFLDFDEKIKVLQEISSEERDRNRSKLKHPGVNFGTGSTRESKRNNLGSAANHQRPVGKV